MFTVNDGVLSGTAENFAEIFEAQDDNGDAPDDIDSTPDQDVDNDTLVDNEIDNGGGDEDDQDIEVIEILFDKAFNMIETGDIKDGKTIMLLQYAKLNSLCSI